MDPRSLVRSVALLSRAATGGVDARALLTELCGLAKDAIAVDAAGVMITDAGGLNWFVHAEPVAVTGLEQLQELQIGPCAEAATTGNPVAVTDFAEYRTATSFREQALALGLRSMLAIPLVSRDRVWGVLDLYRSSSGEWSASDLEAGALLADVAVSFIVTAADRDAARSAQAQMEHLALHDSLTGLPNRILMQDRLQRAVASALRKQTTVAVLFIDLDKFKQINDSYGHAAGDEVLREVAGRLRSTLREQDTLCRFAGDEFVWICNDLTAMAADSGVQLVISRIQHVLRVPVRVREVDVHVSASIGVAIAADAPSVEGLLADADAAMYRAKTQGTGTVVIRDHTGSNAPEYAQQLERDLTFALNRGEMELHYQPIVTADQPRTVAAVEALLRWRRQGSLVLPASAFIDAAVRSGVVVGLGRWAINEACKQIAAWTTQDPLTSPPIVFVNLSARELADLELPDLVTTAVKRHGVSAARIGFEILEDNFVDASILPTIFALQDAGHPIAIDDFGTGYSSLSRLVDFRVEYTKIDKSFTDGLPLDTRRAAVIRDVLSIAKTLSATVIAEGVETADQERHLVQAGCDLLQGYLFGHPEPPHVLRGG